ncbi:MAG: hypothetical protein HC908_13695 [Calothrix sp. SM1_7_51]|nr:hypothetical protein [Calothrix sp. SM1_7_51]
MTLATALIILYKLLVEKNRAYKITLQQIKEMEIKFEGIECRREEIQKLEMRINNFNISYLTQKKQAETEEKEHLQKIASFQTKIDNLEKSIFSNHLVFVSLSMNFKEKKNIERVLR